MGWADCGIGKDGRAMGYAFSGICDHPECEAEIDHGLAYVCGDMHEGGEHGCGKYFCYAHLIITPLGQLCPECAKDAPEWEEGA